MMPGDLPCLLVVATRPLRLALLREALAGRRPSCSRLCCGRGPRTTPFCKRLTPLQLLQLCPDPQEKGGIVTKVFGSALVAEAMRPCLLPQPLCPWTRDGASPALRMCGR